MNAELGPEPRIIVSLGDRWAGVLLCAELRERGRVAAYADGLAAALLLPDPWEVSPVRVVLVDRESLRDRDLATLRWFRASGEGPAAILLTAADGPLPAGPWDRMLRRPVTIGALADAVEHSLKDAVEHSLKSDATVPPEVHPDGIDLRLGWPWPCARCACCGGSRHGEPPRNATDREQTRIALVQFALEHEVHCSKPGPPGADRPRSGGTGEPNAPHGTCDAAPESQGEPKAAIHARMERLRGRCATLKRPKHEIVPRRLT